jgi:RNA polymerase sigma-70 factor (ECF subfamily)
MRKPAFERLVRAAARGSRTALSALCDEIVSRVYYQAAYMTRDGDDAQDVMQESLMRVCDNIRKLRDPKAFYPWMNHIVVNEVRRFMAKKNDRGVVVNIQDYENALPEENADMLPVAYAENAELRAMVIEIIDGLPQRQREAILLYHYDGLSVTDTARVMEISHQAASKLLRLANEKIKSEMKAREKGGATRRVFAFAPAGPVLAQVLEYDARQVISAGAERISRGMAFCAKHITGKAAGGAAVKAAAGGAPAVKSAVAVLLAAAAATGIAAAGLAPRKEAAAPAAMAYEYPEGEIVFSGADRTVRFQNPKHAEVAAYGEAAVLGWEIAAADGSVLYGGAGADADGALAGMQERGEYGGYTLSYTLEGADGSVTVLHRTFTIAPPG